MNLQSHGSNRRGTLRWWIAGGLLACGAVAFVWAFLREPVDDEPVRVWAKLMKSVSSSPDGDVDMYIPVTDHTSTLNMCEVSASLEDMGLDSLAPKPLGDRVVRSTGKSMVVTAWSSGMGRDGPVRYLDTGTTVDCPKCGKIRLLLRRDVALSLGYRRDKGEMLVK